MKNFNRKKLGDLLIENGKITYDQLKEALEKQKTSGKRLGELLIDSGIITEEDIISTLEIQLGIRRVNLGVTDISQEVTKLISENLATKYTLIPVYIEYDTLYVAMADPLNLFALDDVSIVSGYEVEPLIAGTKEIKNAIAKYYSSQYAQKAADELTKEHTSKQVAAESKELEAEVDDVKNAPVVRLVDSIIENSIRAKASDIHIEPFETYVKVRYRVDGELREIMRTPKETQSALITRIKILASLNIAERRIPQDGRIMTTIDGKGVDLRVSILPTVNGEKVVIRILDRENFLVERSVLGLDKEDDEKLDRILSKPYGIVLVTGPTGSGKSTTLYTVLRELNDEAKNIITVEDPVEFVLEGVNQVSVNTKTGLTFAAGLRSILRQDPDIIMIGEIRDGETAEIAIRAAITGHVVLSTLHTNDAPSSVVRLVDMGIEAYLVASSVNGIIAQRLVRRICPMCKEEYQANDFEKEILGVDKGQRLVLYQGKGCPFCNNSGYKGRVGIYEIMEFNKEIREVIVRQGNTDELRDLCVEQGMKTLNKACADKVLKGQTTVSEMMRVTLLKE
ncbi:MAG: Flp pilus assembly complex ATPase component TadA [Clostridiales bacterium]|nr:Flp pilus assembly complex ATPase component TadA [Clostridiales bacterium]